AEMALEVNRGALVALHLGRMKDEGTLRPEHVSMGKMGNVRGALEVARTARSILGGNGITLEYPVIRHMNNLETVLTYEGTHEVHTLSVGKALTGENAFRGSSQTASGAGGSRLSGVTSISHCPKGAGALRAETMCAPR